MSGVYPYCILPSGHHPGPRLAGVDGTSVRAQDLGPFTVWVSSLEAAPPVDLEHIEQHHEVVRAAASAATPVPVRFGAWAPSPEALAERILPRADELEAVLEAVSGRVEYGVLFLDRSEALEASSTEPAAPASGRAYLRALARDREERRGRTERGEELARRLRAHLGSLPVEERVTPARPPGLVAVAHLVARSDRAAYLERVERFVRERAGECEARVTGPWPPYSFAER